MLTVLTHSLRASQRERLGVLASGLHYAGTLALRAFRAWHVQARRQHALRVAVCASCRASLLRRGVRALVTGAAMGQAVWVRGLGLGG